jgi:hypothetical protein
MKIIKERTPETIIDYYIEFTYKDDPEAGFCFPAYSNGDPDLEHMSPEAQANYEACFKDDRLTGPEFVQNKRTYMSPAVGLCTCGREVVLESTYMGATSCECGRWYNVFGQSLLDPKYWDERDGDDDWYPDEEEW